MVSLVTLNTNQHCAHKRSQTLLYLDLREVGRPPNAKRRQIVWFVCGPLLLVYTGSILVFLSTVFFNNTVEVIR